MRVRNTYGGKTLPDLRSDVCHSGTISYYWYDCTSQRVQPIVRTTVRTAEVPVNVQRAVRLLR